MEKRRLCEYRSVAAEHVARGEEITELQDEHVYFGQEITKPDSEIKKPAEEFDSEAENDKNKQRKDKKKRKNVLKQVGMMVASVAVIISVSSMQKEEVAYYPELSPLMMEIKASVEKEDSKYFTELLLENEELLKSYMKDGRNWICFCYDGMQTFNLTKESDFTGILVEFYYLNDEEFFEISLAVHQGDFSDNLINGTVISTMAFTDTDDGSYVDLQRQYSNWKDSVMYGELIYEYGSSRDYQFDERVTGHIEPGGWLSGLVKFEHTRSGKVQYTHMDNGRLIIDDLVYDLRKENYLEGRDWYFVGSETDDNNLYIEDVSTGEVTVLKDAKNKVHLYYFYDQESGEVYQADDCLFMDSFSNSFSDDIYLLVYDIQVPERYFQGN